MELYLQMGHGMQTIAVDLISGWRKGSFIISPVNLRNPNITSIKAISDKIQSVGGRVLFDPQMFYIKDAHTKLQTFGYWPTQGTSMSEDGHKITNQELLNINNLSNCSEIILPGIEMNETYLNYGLDLMSNSAIFFKDNSSKPLLATLCLSSDIIKNTNIIEKLVENLINIPVHGYYIIPHPSNSEYIVSDPSWVIGMLKLITCLKLAEKRVVVGYSNHQSLVYALAGADAIASGTYMNTRSFMPSKFKSPKDGGMRQKSTWFYLPAAFCEYKAALLDIAKQRNYLDIFEPQGEFINEYSSMLFRGAQPSSTNYNERNSFMHYLFCLNLQCGMLTRPTYKESFDRYDFMLNSAENQIREINRKGMSGQNRDFIPAIESNRIAMYANNEDYGLKLDLEWSSMH